MYIVRFRLSDGSDLCVKRDSIDAAVALVIGLLERDIIKQLTAEHKTVIYAEVKKGD